MAKNFTSPAFKISLKDSLSVVKELMAIASPAEFPRLVVIVGPDTYLHDKVMQGFRDQWQKWEDCEIQGWDGASVSNDDLVTLTSQANLFASPNLTIVKRAENFKTIATFLAGLSELPEQTTLCLGFEKKLTQAVEKNIQKLGGRTITFSALYEEDTAYLAKGIAHRLKLSFDEGVFEHILHAAGTDLSTIENELQKLALVFHGHEGVITSEEIQPFINSLKEDHVFALTNYLLDDRLSEASLLIRNLVERGEPGPLILGVLARHCRQTLQVGLATQKGVPQRDLARQLRLPNHVLRRYTDYARRKPLKGMEKTLDLCREVDKDLKVSSYDWELALTRVIDAFS